ncbi:hypothetical protein KUDE01_023414 [Dissostichus eleginoides]|uniref:Uncharacterized protein n=1 Tax=Dissostichus eleginoides TaxID=100907 RepID=A0AAD9EY99_DISEL|nr:hypothetical protein KUDE01_023414 [Dissostichus eleginoides]
MILIYTFRGKLHEETPYKMEERNEGKGRGGGGERGGKIVVGQSLLSLCNLFGNLCLLEAAEDPVDCRSFYWLYSEARFLSLSAVELLPPRVSPLSGQYLHAASDDQCRVNTSQTPASLCSH